MERQYVDSSMITSIGFDPVSSTLKVEFKRGDIWAYPGFPEYLWFEFQAAESKGKFFHQNIKKQYTPSGYKIN